MLTALPPMPRAEPAARSTAPEAAPAPEPGTRFADLLRERHGPTPPPREPARTADAAEPGEFARGRPAQHAPTTASGPRRSAPHVPKQVAEGDPAPTDALPETATGESPAVLAAASDSPARSDSNAPADEEALATGLPLPGTQPLRASIDGGPALAASAARSTNARTPRNTAVAAEADAGPVSGPETPQAAPGPLIAPPAEPPRSESLRAAPETIVVTSPPAAAARALAQAALPSVTLATPLAAPNFGEALAAQVSVFARDGMQQAELRLNPPEMGPIGVQIELVGNDARINFHAAQADTREVIERALPELAGALRDEGLTLAGGGVFDRPADGRDSGFSQGRGDSRPQRASVESLPAVPVRSQPLRQGGVDLYA